MTLIQLNNLICNVTCNINVKIEWRTKHTDNVYGRIVSLLKKITLNYFRTAATICRLPR